MNDVEGWLERVDRYNHLSLRGPGDEYVSVGKLAGAYIVRDGGSKRVVTYPATPAGRADVRTRLAEVAAWTPSWYGEAGDRDPFEAGCQLMFYLDSSAGYKGEWRLRRLAPDRCEIVEDWWFDDPAGWTPHDETAREVDDATAIAELLGRIPEHGLPSVSRISRG